MDKILEGISKLMAEGLFPFVMVTGKIIDPKKIKWQGIIEHLVSGLLIGLLMMWGAIKVLETKFEYIEKIQDKNEKRLLTVESKSHSHMQQYGLEEYGD